MSAAGSVISGGPLMSTRTTGPPPVLSSSSSNNNGHDVIQDCFSGLFLESLYRVSQEVHPGFGIQREALEYVETLIIRLLVEILGKHPHSIADVEQHVQQCFPEPVNSWAIREAHEAAGKPSNKKPKEKMLGVTQKVLPVLKERLGYKIDTHVVTYLMAILEYVAADILKLCGNYVKNIRHNEIALQDLKVAMRADTVLMEMFYRDSDDVVPSPISDDLRRNVNSSSMAGGQSVTASSYEQTVKDFLHAETQYLRDLNIILHVYRRAFSEIRQLSMEKVEAIFSNILEIHEFTVRFIGLLEDTIEMTRESCAPAVGSCFLETAEAAEFEVYEKYALDILSNEYHIMFYEMINSAVVREALGALSSGFYLSAKYLLPKLLLIPVAHCRQYFDFINNLTKLSPYLDDQEDLRQTESLLVVLKSRVEHEFFPAARKKLSNYITLRLAPAGHHHTAYAKLLEIQKNIDGWESRALNINCSEFVCEGDLGKVSAATNKIDGLWTKTIRLTERRCFLFDSVLILCKALPRRSGAGAGSAPELRLKELLFIRKVEIIDREDTDELRNSFELRSKDNHIVHSLILFAKSVDEKANWLSALVMLTMRSTIERMRDSQIEAEQKRVPLLLPPKEIYRFAEPDSDDNIVFEEYTSSSGVPVVRGATLTKLVERLTYHLYADPKFVRTFLTTYRSFCSSNELLSLLIERFHVPDNTRALGDAALESDPFVFDRLKRLRKEYVQPVQLRVLNVIRQWVDHHWYDFDGEPELLNELKAFLIPIKSPNTMVKWITSLLNIIERKCDVKEEIKGFQFATDPPPIEWHLAQLPDQYDLMTLHPIEIARQVTLIEFDLYRAVKPIELVGAAWTKKDKDKRSPQLLKLIRHSTKFTYWLENCIVECGNIEERVAVMNRILEIMCVFQELNNFTGLIEIYGVLESSAVHRLDFTWERLDQKLLNKFKKVKALLSDAHHKQIREKLRSIDPPCVPFFGMYLSNIIFLEEGNPVFLKMPLAGQASEADAAGDVPSSNHEKSLLISFTKCRKIAEIISEIQMYQNQPYCLTVEPSIRCFFESLDPLAEHPDKNEFERLLYERSLEIEPKDCDKAPVFPAARRYTLKSPGIESRSKSRLKHRTGFNHPLTPSARSIAATPSTAPPSPSAGSVLSVIDIHAGSAPRFLCDVGPQDTSDDWTNKKAVFTLPARLHHQSHSQSMDEGSRKPDPPKIPPRNRLQSSAASLPAPVHFIYPPCLTEQPQVSAAEASSTVPTPTSAATTIATPPPPLPPRISSAGSRDPPPRPPKGTTMGVRPPLPPKTYKKASS